MVAMGLAVVTIGAAWIANQHGPLKAPPKDPEKLFLEAATFFDIDKSHYRVSEAKAISDLLILAPNSDTSLLHQIVKKYGSMGEDRSLSCAAACLNDLAFTLSRDRHELTLFLLLEFI